MFMILQVGTLMVTILHDLGYICIEILITTPITIFTPTKLLFQFWSLWTEMCPIAETVS